MARLALTSPQAPAARGERFILSHAAFSTGALDVMRGRRIQRRFAPHLHEFLAVGLIDDGRSSVRYRGASWSASAGALVTISAGETHTGEPADDAGWSYRMLYPQPALFRAALAETRDSDETTLFVAPFVVDPYAASLFEIAFDALMRRDCALAAEEHLLVFLRALAMRHGSPGPRRRRADRGARIAAVAREYLEAHFAEQVQLATLADICGVSPFHLIRIFRRERGLPPHAYLKQLRVARALEMLRQGAPASRVAHACGFSDQSHLTRAFTSTIGVAPGRYQRAITCRVVPAARTSPPRTRAAFRDRARSC